MINIIRDIRKVLNNIFSRKTRVQIVDLRKGDKIIYQIGSSKYKIDENIILGFKRNMELLTNSDKYNKLFVDFPVSIIVIRGSNKISKSIKRMKKGGKSE